MKFLKALFAVIALAAMFIVAVGFYLSPQSDLAKADAIVIISGGETDLRVKEGVELYHNGFAPKIIMSGAARDQGISNAEAMRQLAIKSGVAREQILVEEFAQNTIGNAKLAKQLIVDQNIKSIILVTSPYHQRRAYITFRTVLGPEFPIYNHSAKDSAWRKNGWWQDNWARGITFSELQKILATKLFFKQEQ